MIYRLVHVVFGALTFVASMVHWIHSFILFVGFVVYELNEQRSLMVEFKRFDSAYSEVQEFLIGYILALCIYLCLFIC